MIDSSYNFSFDPNKNNDLSDRKQLYGYLCLTTVPSHRTYLEKIVDSQNRVEYKFKTEFLADDFRPNEIKLKLNGATLTVEAIKEIKTCKSANALNTISNDVSFFSNFKESEKFKREIDLPPFLDLATLNCYLETYQRAESVLLIEALIDKCSELYRQLNETKCDSPTASEKERVFDIQSPPEIKPRSKMNGNCNRSTTTAPAASNSEFLKFKFDLKGYDSNKIILSIRNKSGLHISASKHVVDSNGELKQEQFEHEINLPGNAEIYNIRNCFDESDGVLRIEIPFSKEVTNNQYNLNTNSGSDKSAHCSTSSACPASPSMKNIASCETFNNNAKNEKYLELTFDLYDFKFDDV